MIKEGKTLIFIPDPKEAIVKEKFEPTRLRVFYNPIMEFNRDLSILALQAYINLYATHKPVRILEPLSATGIRGIRYALELEDINEIIINDLDKYSWKIMKRNVKLNRVEDIVKTFNRDASSLMHYLHKEEPTPISIIDLDPYGSPAPFADSALSLLGHRGLLAVTATDLAVLSGSKKWKALKRYWIASANIPQKKEAAVRVLLGYLAKIATAYDKVLIPLLSYYSDHYVRVYVLIERNSSKAVKVLENEIGYITYCEQTGQALLVPEPEVCHSTGDKGHVLGPLWIGNFMDTNFLYEITKLLNTKFSYLNTSKRIEKLLTSLIKEAPLQRRIYQYIPAIASKVSSHIPKFSKLLECLKTRNLISVRTHFDPLGIRTLASYSELVSCIWKSLT